MTMKHTAVLRNLTVIDVDGLRASNRNAQRHLELSAMIDFLPLQKIMRRCSCSLIAGELDRNERPLFIIGLPKEEHIPEGPRWNLWGLKSERYWTLVQ